MDAGVNWYLRLLRIFKDVHSPPWFQLQIQRDVDQSCLVPAAPGAPELLSPTALDVQR